MLSGTAYMARPGRQLANAWRMPLRGVECAISRKGLRHVCKRSSGGTPMRERFSFDADDLAGPSVQDRDLFTRMSAYVNGIDARVRQGQGWCIFNTDRTRATRIANYLLASLRGRMPPVSNTTMTWRDFALNAYITEVALPREEEEDPAPEPESIRARERNIARRVSREAYWRALNVDVLVLLDLAPAHAHEINFLDAILESRYRIHLPTVLTTPLMPDSLKDAVIANRQGDGAEIWDRLWTRIYDTCLIAV